MEKWIYCLYTDYFEHVNNEVCTIVQIETKEAIDNIENIANVNGVVSNLSFRWNNIIHALNNTNKFIYNIINYKIL